MNLVYKFLRAPPKRASGDVCFLLTFDYMDVSHPDTRELKLTWGNRAILRNHPAPLNEIVRLHTMEGSGRPGPGAIYPAA
jgi:hypothetical protein